MTTFRSITKSVSLDCAPEKAFGFLARPENWPRWAVVNVLAVAPSKEEGWWDMRTPHGDARLRLRPDAAHGILDHDFRDPQASWSVPARVVANGGGSEFQMTFFQPPQFSDAFFDGQIALVDRELAALKAILEAEQAG